jgi:hypothetical protein
MLAFVFQFAATEPFAEQLNRATRGSGLSTRDLLLAALAGSLLALAIFIWTYLRFQRKRQKAEARDFARLTTQSTSSHESEDGTRRRRRRRRRAHRPRNPSLQQTGGLPPPRPEDQPPKY